MLAIKSGNEALVKRLLVKDINIKVNTTNKDALTPLILEVEKGNEMMVKPLLTKEDIEVSSKGLCA
jgi:hypothetical protein